MLKLDRVTFTGADDSIMPSSLVSISRDYPWVEWGILFSKSNQGKPRYPSQEWLKEFYFLMAGHSEILRSAHLCGRWVREMMIDGELTWFASDPNVGLFQRVQINFHGQYHAMHQSVPRQLGMKPSVRFILQCDGPNDDQVSALAHMRVVVPLFDKSGGAGRLPDEWPRAWPGIYCGYAGGLGPDNIYEQIEHISKVSSGPFWVDMERRVRSEDDREFELGKVREVCRQVQSYARDRGIVL